MTEDQEFIETRKATRDAEGMVTLYPLNVNRADRWCWAHDSEFSTGPCDCPEEMFR
jgi:hypothetical protein